MKRIAINFVEITTDLPERVQLIPAGAVVGRDGRQWVLDDPQQVVNRFIEQGADLPVDIEHSTELRAPKGEPAPAAGWVHQLEVIDGAIWGAVNWNETGRGLVGGKQYRYLSPVILYSPGDGSIKGLTSEWLSYYLDIFWILSTVSTTFKDDPYPNQPICLRCHRLRSRCLSCRLAAQQDHPSEQVLSVFRQGTEVIEPATAFS